MVKQTIITTFFISVDDVFTDDIQRKFYFSKYRLN